MRGRGGGRALVGGGGGRGPTLTIGGAGGGGGGTGGAASTLPGGTFRGGRGVVAASDEGVSVIEESDTTDKLLATVGVLSLPFESLLLECPNEEPEGLKCQ